MGGIFGWVVFLGGPPVHDKVPEGHHPRGTTLREALRRNLPLRGFSGASAGVSLRVLRGLRGALRRSAGFAEGSDPILVTLETVELKGIFSTHTHTPAR